MQVKKKRQRPTFYMLGELQVWRSLKNITPSLILESLTLSSAGNAACQVVCCLHVSKWEDQQKLCLQGLMVYHPDQMQPQYRCAGRQQSTWPTLSPSWRMLWSTWPSQASSFTFAYQQITNAVRCFTKVVQEK